jgi:hypothetical protein
MVLRKGGIYTWQHVRRLAEQIGRNTPMQASMFVLDETVMAHKWRGWWSKIELFRPGLFTGPVVYFDLDTTIIGSLGEILDEARKPGWRILRDAYRPQDGWQSSAMSWHGDELAAVYREFRKSPEEHMRLAGGDQDFIQQCGQRGLIAQPIFWQDVLPGQFVSYKVDVQGRSVPRAARVVIYHGQPKPWDVDGQLPERASDAA